ncbi:MAG: ABC transporter permease [Rhodospirillaceae bacterium]|nr:ABC transporter permease [Rhodospirillaceae bacterium]|tara:strand:+ start:605 stop:1312 length:708 start_codon:yes stop_codon:yes gene_type:complete
MEFYGDSLYQALRLILSADSNLAEIFWLSVKVSLTALLIACALGLPFGAFLAVHRFSGRGMLIGVINTLMGMPPVVVGLLVYLHLSRSGPLGWMGLLYTPTAMIIAQVILITPIIAALSCQIIEDLHEDYRDLFTSLCVPGYIAVFSYIYDARYSLLTVVLAGFGRAVSEVGAVIVVGGNIDHLTRVMTTTIALETSKGELELALALGLILMVKALFINVCGLRIKTIAHVKAYV